MLNKERVILMTKMASYEENEGRKDRAVMSYFRGDYVWFQVLKSVVYGTIAFGIVFGMYIFYDFEVFMMDIYKMDLLEFGKSIVILYLCVVGAYGVISYVMFASKYSRARKSLKHYYDNLKKLSNMYDK